MSDKIAQVVRICEYWQQYKRINCHYTQVSPKNVLDINPWDVVAIDMIGPWKVRILDIDYIFLAMTCINDVINIPEIISVVHASSIVLTQAFEND